MKNKLGGAANSLKRGYPLFPGNAAAGALACGLAAVLGACATAPSEPVSEKLDPDTATTVKILSRPIELLSQKNRGGKQTDPFAYIAPFETNRMGARDLFLWVSTPQEQGQLTQPQLLCNGQPLDLQPLSQDSAAAGVHAKPGDNVALVGGSSGTPAKVDLSQLQLSRAPYEAPVPWSTQWYFRLPADSLKCLADADGISLEVRDADGGPDQFTTSGRKNLASLDAFTRR
jgi:hypothetical protein